MGACGVGQEGGAGGRSRGSSERAALCGASELCEKRGRQHDFADETRSRGWAREPEGERGGGARCVGRGVWERERRRELLTIRARGHRL